jgi:hypothetical protein
MMEWWDSLSSLNQGFYVAAVFFSVFFVWQLVSALLGLSGEGDAEMGGDVGAHDGGGDVSHDVATHDGADQPDATHDAHATVGAFKLLSVRSVIAFFTLFTWAGALYLQEGVALSLTLLYALLWGLAAALAVSAIFSLLQRLTESGNMRLGKTVGQEGTVYLNIPSGGNGEVRVMAGNVLAVLKARSADGTAIPAGTSVRVTRVLAAGLLEVTRLEANNSAS